MKKTFCDGPCGRELAPGGVGMRPDMPPVCAVIEVNARALSVRRIPPGTYHLCSDCAKLALNALKPKEQ